MKYVSLKKIVNDKLQAPLLDPTEVDYDSDYDEPLQEISVTKLNDDNEAATTTPAAASVYEDPAISLIYAGLLASQFGMAWGMQHLSTAFGFIVMCSICLFLVSAALYKDSLATRSNSNSSSLCVLLPEVMVNIIIGVIYFGQVEWGFFTLLGCMIVLKMAVIVMTLMELFNGSAADDEQEEEQETANQLWAAQVV